MPPRRHLDPRICYLKRIELGSVQAVVDWLTECGKINPYTGKPFSFEAVALAIRFYRKEHGDGKDSARF